MTKRSNNLVLRETNRAIQLADKGRKNEAFAIYRQIADSIPDDLETRGQFTRLCLSLGNIDSAIEILKDITHDYPQNAFYKGMLGGIYLHVGQLQEAESVLQQSIELDPNQWMVHADMGLVYGKLEQNEKGIHHLETAIKLKPSNPESYANLTNCLLGAGRYEEALTCGEKAIRLDPKNPNNYDNLARVLSHLGRLTEATSNFEKAIALDGTFGAAYLNFSRIKKFSEKDRSFIDKIEKQLQSSLPVEERIRLHFVLGKAYDDCRQYDKAFTHFRQANVLSKPRRPVPPDLKHLLKSLKKVFTKERLNMASEIGNASDIPVFIVGMPRSGTSLIEQIISRHSRASGAGELTTIFEFGEEIYPPQDYKNYVSEWIKSLNQDNLNKYAATYLDVLRKNKENSLHITDKLPENYFYLGFIHLLFPNAKIIHAIRNPIDTCLSCYFQSFTSVDWSYDMDWIVKRYRLYRQIMAYWKSVFPPGIILDVNYESLIENQEAESRKLIAHCGLDWEEGCLDYQNDQRAVATASLWQVRQPIYKSSVKRWMNYAPHIVHLVKSLSNYLEREDIQSLKQVGINVKSWGWW